jgi:hypothetical protein
MLQRYVENGHAGTRHEDVWWSGIMPPRILNPLRGECVRLRALTALHAGNEASFHGTVWTHWSRGRRPSAVDPQASNPYDSRGVTAQMRTRGRVDRTATRLRARRSGVPFLQGTTDVCSPKRPNRLCGTASLQWVPGPLLLECKAACA